MIDESLLKEWIANGAIISCGQGMLLIGWGERRALKSQAEATGSSAFYFPGFFLDETYPWFEHEKTCVVSIEDLLNPLNSIAEQATVERIGDWRCPHYPIFETAFHEIQQKIAIQEIKKAVPFVFENSPEKMRSDKLISSLKSVLNYIKNNPAYIYGFWGSEHGILGATPELLFRLNDDERRLESIACAGTTTRDREGIDLNKDPKIALEHQLVVEGITESLSPFGTVTVGERRLLHLPRIVHLATPIHVTLDRVIPFESAVRALHPTPALGAFPKLNGAAWLKQYQQKIDRVRFGAPAGYIQNGQASCYVAIRNAQWNSYGIHIGAGCGVVAGSKLDEEWAEINIKLNAIKELLSL